MKLINNIKKNTILLLLITIIVLYFVLRKEFSEIINILKGINVFFFVIALIFYFIHLIIRGYANYLIVNDKEKLSLKESIKQNLIAQFFNGITPFQTGGEPMEIYMLTECGISLSKATNYKVQGFIFYQIALVLCGISAIGYNYIFKLFPKVKILQNLVLIGFIINIVIAIILILSYSKKIVDKLSKLVIRISKGLKLKVKEETVENKFREYYEASKELKKDKKKIVIGITLNILSLLSLYITPLFILYSFNNHDVSIIETLVSSAYVYLIGAFVPIPGASGGIEYGFTRFFGVFLNSGLVSATLLVWRAITYYLGIILGAIVFNFHKKEKKICE